MIDILVLLLKPSLYFISNPKKYWYLLPITVVAWFADVFANYLTISVISNDGFPRKGEFTFSQRLGLQLGTVARTGSCIDKLHSRSTVSTRSTRIST